MNLYEAIVIGLALVALVGWVRLWLSSRELRDHRQWLRLSQHAADFLRAELAAWRSRCWAEHTLTKGARKRAKRAGRCRP